MRSPVADVIRFELRRSALTSGRGQDFSCRHVYKPIFEREANDGLHSPPDIEWLRPLVCREVINFGAFAGDTPAFDYSVAASMTIEA